MSNKFSAAKQNAIAAVTADGSDLANLPEFHADKDVVLAAVSNYGAALEYASDELKADKEVVIAAVTNDPYVLDFAAEEMRDDDDVMDACAGE